MGKLLGSNVGIIRVLGSLGLRLKECFDMMCVESTLNTKHCGFVLHGGHSLHISRVSRTQLFEKLPYELLLILALLRDPEGFRV